MSTRLLNLRTGRTQLAGRSGQRASRLSSGYSSAPGPRVASCAQRGPDRPPDRREGVGRMSGTTNGSLPGPTSSGSARAADGRRPRLVLRLGDAVAIFVAFAAVSAVAGAGRLDPMGVVLAPSAGAAIGVWAIRVHGLVEPPHHGDALDRALQARPGGRHPRRRGARPRPGRRAVRPRRRGRSGLRHVVGAARGLAFGVPFVGRPQPPQRPLRPPRDPRRHRSSGD